MTERLPDQVDLGSMAEAGRQLSGEVELIRLDRILPLLNSGEGALQVSLIAGKDANGIRFVTGNIKGGLQLQCQRCLGAFIFPVDLQFSLGLVRDLEESAVLPERYEPLIVETEPYNLLDVVTEEILLALPIAALHEDRRLCKKTGNEYKVPAASKRENPFAVLAQMKQKH